ncbi:MAG: cupin domain-containing protein [Desulfobacteraceae bacterium]|jgi:quercetin dioxygenase-like cupin family protein|nr:cupin domain-containing protein [Desulfobacteraceae bacterium]
MKIFDYSGIPGIPFDNGPARGVVGRVAIGKADGAASFCMRVFEIAPGGHTPRHRHAWEHEIFVHAGRGEIHSDDRWHPIGPGTAVFVPGDVEHQIRNPGDKALVFVCLIPAGAPEL